MKRALLVIAATVVVIGLGVAALLLSHPGSAAVVHTAPHRRAVVIAASDDFAVYQEATRGNSLNAGDYYGGHLYAVSSAGGTRALTGFRDGPRGVGLVRDTLVQATNHTSANSSHYTVHYLDLASGRQGDVTLPAGEAELSAAPGGFVSAYRPGISTADGEVLDLEVQSYSGLKTSLGTPYPDGRVFTVVAGDFGLVAVTSSSDELPNLDSTIRYMRWDQPGVWSTIFDAHVADYLSCARPSATSVACFVYGPDASGSGRAGLISLRGGKPVWLPRSTGGSCSRLNLATLGSSLVAIETANVGGCLDGMLIRLGANGAVAMSSTRYSGPGSIAVGLGGILVSNRQQRAIELLAGVSQLSRLLVRA